MGSELCFGPPRLVQRLHEAEVRVGAAEAVQPGVQVAQAAQRTDAALLAIDKEMQRHKGKLSRAKVNKE